MTTLLIGLVVLACSTLVDYTHTRYVQNVQLQRGHAAAAWSLFQWAAGAVSWVIAIKVTLWVLPFEALGQYIGTVLAVRKREAPSAPGNS